MKSVTVHRAFLLGSTLAALWSIPVHAADIAAGEKVFRVCRQCHHIGVGATNFYGPVLNGLVGRKAGTVTGYNYSQANKESAKTWDVPTLTAYLKQPQHEVPKTYMSFAGLKNDKDIEDVIAFIAQFETSGAQK